MMKKISDSAIFSKKIFISGIVQGVGFRPFVSNLAKKFRLKGFVKNTNSNISILIQAKDSQKMVDFVAKLRANPPQNAIISHIKISTIRTKKIFSDFQIIGSDKTNESYFYSAIPRDLAICKSCQKELQNPQNRRFGYAFINCINCGPRWSIIQNLPYDRERTAMSGFKMCESCEREYGDIKNRRFHAQPNSCADCGIKMQIFDKNGVEVLCESSSDLGANRRESSKKIIDSRESNADFANQRAIFANVCEKIKQSKIICLKGIGGFNLICAVETKAIAELRARKSRPRKPFAIMFGDINSAKKYFHISAHEETALLSPSAPIVLLNRPKVALPQNLSFHLNTYGVIIAYSALHKLLFKDYKKPLIFTSANLSGEPIITQKATAQAKIAHIYDYLVDYNRAIINPIDDSLKRILRNGKAMNLRAGRGDYPLLKHTKFKSDEVILALGAHQKSQIAIFFSGYMLISRYIGDLDNVDSINALKYEINFLLELYNLAPSVILCDCHSGYESSKIAVDLARKFGAKIARIYHHRAHFYSSLFDNNLAHKNDENILGVVFDGTGLGEDGTIWGGEFFLLKNVANVSSLRGESLDLPKQSIIKSNLCDSTESRPLRGAKNRIQGCSSATADFLLEAEKRGSPPKSEKAAAFWEHNLNEVGGSGSGVQPFLRKETSESKGQNGESNADSHLNHCDSHNLDSRDLDSSLRATRFAQNDGLCVDCFDSQSEFRNDSAKLRHIANFSHFALLGGESAIKDIRKIALGILFSVYGKTIPLESHFENVALFYQMFQKNLNTLQTSSVGRIFDFVAFMCGLDSQSFEGESGGFIEAHYNPKIRAHYGVEICDGEIRINKIIRGIVRDYGNPALIATKFINTLAQIIAQIALDSRQNAPNLKVIFSGGVFANKILCDKISALLKARSIRHYFSYEIPTNDGGIAVGQIVAYLRGDFESNSQFCHIERSEISQKNVRDSSLRSE
ncbi:Kae1-like domain-containing protein [Helicobacter sp. 23-1044]